MLAALSPRLDAPLPRQMLEELAGLLAPWPEARATAEKSLRLLEPARARQSTAERTADLARHGLLAAQCGMTGEAGRWLREALAAQRTTSYTAREFTPNLGGASAARMRSNFRVNVLLDIFEGFSLCKETTLASEAEAEMRKLLPRDTALASLAHERVRRITAARHPAAGLTKGEWESQSPGAWLHRSHDDGTAEVGWALGRISPVGSGPAMKFTTQDQALAFSRGKPLRVELFYGASPERLVRFATVENAAATGTWRGPLPRPVGVLAASFSFDGQTVMGPALPFSQWKDLLPPLDGQLANLPKLLWSRGTLGPGGASLSGLQLSPYERAGRLANADLALPEAAGQNLTVSGWVRNGTVELVVIPAKGGAERVLRTLEFREAQEWQRFEFDATTDQPWRAPESKDARCVLRLTTGEYSGLRVATKNRPR